MHSKMSGLGRVVALLVGGASVFVACAAEKAVDTGSRADAGLFDSPVDSLLDTLGIDIDPAKDAAADIGEIKPGTRLRPRLRVNTGADGSIVKAWAGTYWDDSRKEECGPRGADGKVRCLPTSVAENTGGVYFAESSCTTPLYYRPKTACGSDGTPAKYIALNTYSGCGASTKVFPIAGTLSTWSTYIKSGTTCVLTTSAGLPGDAVTVGAEVAPADFVEIATTIE